MSFADYAKKSIALHAELRRSNRALAMLVSVGQAAAVMALVLSVADLANVGIFVESPARRFGFIAVWAVMMTGLGILRPRQTPAASH